jgi:hypothetical protein
MWLAALAIIKSVAVELIPKAIGWAVGYLKQKSKNAHRKFKRALDK